MQRLEVSGAVRPMYGSLGVKRLYVSTCFEHYVLIIRRSKLYYTASGVITPVHGTATYRCDDTRCCIIQFDLLMMSTYCSKHVEAYNKLIIKQDFCINFVNC